MKYEDALSLIAQANPFHAFLEDGSLEIKILEYTPYIFTAIHHGHRLRQDLKEICLVSEDGRYHEEDAYTGDLIEFFPITLIAHDSRYEYDLNRDAEKCLYQEAWGDRVYKRALTKEEIQESIRKYNQFYTICDTLVKTVLSKYPNCLILDIHSYNIQDRDYVNPPMFNIGTHFINLTKYRPFVDEWMKQLDKIKIPGHEVTVKENDIFWGMGNLSERMNGNYDDCLVLPTEVKKIYADEFKPEPYRNIITTIERGFKSSIEQMLPLLLMRNI